MVEPRFSLADLSDAELEQALTRLGEDLVFPPTPDLAGAVSARVREWPPPHVASRAVGAPRRLLWLAAAAVLAVLLGAIALFPEARTAIADRLGLRGVLIQWVEEMPTPAPAPVGATMRLGRSVTLDEARETVDFPILVPDLAGFDDPDEVYLQGQGDDAMVSFVYAVRSDLPRGEIIGVGALLTQFRGTTERPFVEKGLRDDGGAMQTELETVSVGDGPGFWISGAPHTVFLVCREGNDCREERYRLAANVLLWEQDGLTLRLESALSREESLTIAASVRASD